MNLSLFATRHLRAILFVTIVFCRIGAWILESFPVSILPDVSFPRIVIIADAGDRPARMMEVSVTRPLEQEIATIPGSSLFWVCPFETTNSPNPCGYIHV